MLLFPIFLLALAIQPCLTTSEKIENLVDAAIDVFKNANAYSEDSLLALSSFGPKLERLINSTIPVGELAFNMSKWEARSDDYKVLTDFKSADTWELEMNIFKTSRSNINGDSYVEKLSNYYNMKIHREIKKMKRITNMFIDPTNSRDASYVRLYRTHCLYRNQSPEKILEYLKLLLVTYCPNPLTPREAQILAEHRSYLMDALVRFRVEDEPIPDPSTYLAEYVRIYERNLRKYPLSYLNTFDKFFSSYDTAVSKFFKDLRNEGSDNKISRYETSCLLRTAIEGSNFNRISIDHFVKGLMSDLTDLAYIAGVCANVVSGGDAGYVEDYRRQITNLTSQITTHTAKWFNESLTSAWPSAHYQVVKEQIIRNGRSLRSVANATHPILQQTGQPNYTYEMMFVRSDEENFQFYYRGDRKSCHFEKDDSGFNTVIRRIPLNITAESGKRTSQFEKSKYDWARTVLTEMEDIHGSPMRMIESAARTARKHITRKEDDFQCLAVIYKRSPNFWNACPVINDRFLPYNSRYVNRIPILDYTNKGWFFQQCEKFRFHFM